MMKTKIELTPEFKAILYTVIIVSLFLLTCLAFSTYNTSQLYECRRIGMELSMSAVDIQAICK